MYRKITAIQHVEEAVLQQVPVCAVFVRVLQNVGGFGRVFKKNWAGISLSDVATLLTICW